MFVFQKTDVLLPDVLPIRLERTYRQRDARVRAFGVGTSHSYELLIVGDTFP